MRTTVTLDSDTEQLLRERMRRRGVSFKQALNDSIRDANSRGHGSPTVTRTQSLGSPALGLDHALRVAADLEDTELARKMDLGK